MSILILSNTSGQIDFTLKESYARLTGGFVGPTGVVDGFAIQDGNKQTGIYVGNSCIQACKNTIDFKESANVNLLVPATRCFSISGNGSSVLFNQEGTISLGSGIDSNYKGIQSYSTNPSLVLRNTNSTCNQAIRFLNDAGIPSFHVCQNNALGVSVSGKCLEFLTSTGPSICLSGDYISFNAPIDPNYNNLIAGSTFLSGSSYLRDGTTGSGIFCYFNSDVNQIGFNINTCSCFCKNATFSGGLFITGTGNTSFLCSDNYICSRTGYFNCSSGSVSNYTTSINNTLCIKDYGCISDSNGLNFTGNKIAFLSGICTSGICIASGYFNSHLPNGLNVLSGNLNLTGALKIYTNSLNPTSNSICGCSFELISTSIATAWPNTISGNSSISGCLSGTGISYFNSFCAFNAAATSCFLGPLCAAINVCTALVCSANICGNHICASQLLSGSCGCFSCFQQLDGNQISCFCSSGLNIGLSQTGYICAVNTAKAWGLFTLKDGGATNCSGYNFSSLNTYASGNNASCQVIAYGLCFCNPIKYPFVVNFNVYGTGYFYTSATNPIGFTGLGTRTACTLVQNDGVNATLATIPFSVQFFAISGKQAGGNLTAFAANTCYSEIYFNLQNCKGPATLFSELTRANADGIVHFNIFGF